MSDQTKYPARGQVSEDGRIYTDDEGNVYNLSQDSTYCPDCVFNNIDCESLVKVSCRGGVFKRIEGAYVPSDCELAACDMARAHIIMCETHHISFDGCRACCDFFDKKCHLRKYLAAHGDAKAWEVE